MYMKRKINITTCPLQQSEVKQEKEEAEDSERHYENTYGAKAIGDSSDISDLPINRKPWN